MRYVAKRKFEYNGKHLKPGDVWEPVGGKWDESIKKHMVVVDDSPEPKAEVKKRGRPRKQ